MRRFGGATGAFAVMPRIEFYDSVFDPTGAPGPFVGVSAAASRIRASIRSLARGSGALVRGERGSGRTFVTRLLHALSPDPFRPVVVVRAAGGGGDDLPAALASAAERAASLLLEEVHLLDERARLVLRDHLERASIPFVLATSALPAAGDEEDALTRALLSRLGGEACLDLPPLRERRDDIAPLAEHFARETSRRFGVRAPALGAGALAHLASEPWPENVRGLRAAVVRAVALSSRGVLGPEDFTVGRTDDREGRHDTIAGPPLPAAHGETADLPLGPETYVRLVEDFDRAILARALEERKSIRGAASLLGISRNTMKTKMSRYGLKAAPEE